MPFQSFSSVAHGGGLVGDADIARLICAIFSVLFCWDEHMEKITTWTVSTVSQMLRRVVEVVDFPDVYRA